MAARYAIYYVPPDASQLAQFGRAWLGRCAVTGQSVPQPAIDRISPEKFARLTAEPRRYGFHATLKAPMHLAAPATETDLDRACRAFAAVRHPFPVALAVGNIDRFLALVPSGPSDELLRLAAECVTHFDRFRRPAEPAELARRRAQGLTPRQDSLLMTWGYPYVLEEFRFHMTLTGPIADPVERARLADDVNHRLRSILAAPISIDSIALFRQFVPEHPFLRLAEYRFRS